MNLYNKIFTLCHKRQHEIYLTDRYISKYTQIKLGYSFIDCNNNKNIDDICVNILLN